MRTLHFDSGEITYSAFFEGWFVETDIDFKTGDRIEFGDSRGPYPDRATVILVKEGKALIQSDDVGSTYINLLFATTVTIFDSVEN